MTSPMNENYPLAIIKNKHKATSLITRAYYFLVLDTKFALFLVIVAFVAAALYSSSINFVSALETNCYAFGQGDNYQGGICIHTFDEYNPPRYAITYCDKDKNCTTTYGKESTVTPGVKDSFNKFLSTNQAALSPDLGTERKAGDVPKQFQFPNKTTLAP